MDLNPYGFLPTTLLMLIPIIGILGCLALGVYLGYAQKRHARTRQAIIEGAVKAAVTRRQQTQGIRQPPQEP